MSKAMIGFGQSRAAGVAWGVLAACTIGSMALPAAAQEGELVWARAMGGTDNDGASAIALDTDGNVYTTGRFRGIADFDPGPGTNNLTSAGLSDIYIQKMDNEGNFVWVRSMGSTGDDRGNGIAVDANGNVYITGSFHGTVDFDPGPGTSNLTSAGSADIFVQKLDSNGNLIWARSMGGTQFDQGLDIAVDTAGNVYTVGSFRSMVDFDPGPGTSNLISKGGTDIFVHKLDSNGTFVWARSMGGSNDDICLSIEVDEAGFVYTTGSFVGTVDFDPGPGVFNLVSAGGGDSFVQKLDSNGNFVWARSMGGPQSDRGQSIAVNAAGDVYSTGWFVGTADFDPGPGTNNLTAPGSDDFYIHKLDSDGNLVWARSAGGTNTAIGYGIVIDAAGNVFTAGRFQGTADFDPGPETFNLTSAGSADIFVQKLDSDGNFLWARATGGVDPELCWGLALDLAGNIYMMGYFSGTADFDPGPDTFNLTSAGGEDIFVLKLSGPPAVPTLTLSPMLPGSGNVMISWQPDEPGWVLQHSATLISPAWTNTSSGSTNPVVLPAGSPTRFYRAIQP